jgi:hypothetical protein
MRNLFALFKRNKWLFLEALAAPQVRRAFYYHLRACTRLAYESVLLWCTECSGIFTLVVFNGYSIDEAKSFIQQHRELAEIRYEYFRREGR